MIPVNPGIFENLPKRLPVRGYNCISLCFQFASNKINKLLCTISCEEWKKSVKAVETRISIVVRLSLTLVQQLHECDCQFSRFGRSLSPTKCSVLVPLQLGSWWYVFWMQNSTVEAFESKRIAWHPNSPALPVGCSRRESPWLLAPWI